MDGIAGSKTKYRIIEIPDMNEEIPTLQPEGSSTDSKDVSTNVDMNEESPTFQPHANDDQNNRWTKRLRVSYSNEYSVGTKNSDIREPLAHKKYGESFNKTMKTATENDYPPSCPIDGIENLDHSCPWVQRWWKDSTFASNLSLKKVDPHVLCEPHIGVDELGKRQFPSIGAMALMGKTLNGFRSCEIKKKGSVFVWNTKEY